jgi:hypothetical protein
MLYLPPLKNLSDIQIEIRGSFVGMPTESLQLATFVAVIPAQDQWLG